MACLMMVKVESMPQSQTLSAIDVLMRADIQKDRLVRLFPPVNHSVVGVDGKGPVMLHGIVELMIV